MQLEMRKVRLDSTDVKRIYFDAFPKKERMPFPMMVAMSKLWHTQFWGFYYADLFIWRAAGKSCLLCFLRCAGAFGGKGTAVPFCGK